MRTDESPALRRMQRILEPPPARAGQAWMTGAEQAGSEVWPDAEEQAGSEVWPDAEEQAGSEVWPDAEEQAGTDMWPGVEDGPGDADSSVVGLPGPRLALDRRAALAVGVVVLAGSLICLWLVLRPGPSAQALPPRAGAAPGSVGGPALLTGTGPAASGAAAEGGAVPAAGGAGSGAAAGPAATPGTAISVYVVGAVHHPGVVQLAAGTRVADAVEAAGGATSRADLTVINLAQKITDGEQIVVPKPGQASTAAGVSNGPAGSAGSSGASGPAGGASSAGPAQPLNLNTSTEQQFDELPGIGPVMAGRIIAWRQQNGQFSSVDQLGEVSGIGDVTLQKLRPLVTV